MLCPVGELQPKYCVTAVGSVTSGYGTTDPANKYIFVIFRFELKANKEYNVVSEINVFEPGVKPDNIWLEFARVIAELALKL